MLTNSGLTIYHKYYDNKNKIEKWKRFNYANAWVFGGKGSGLNKGYENANDVQIRIFYKNTEDLDIKNFSIGDIVVGQSLSKDIKLQSDLKGYEFYNITSINNNNFGNNPHIHIGGK